MQLTCPNCETPISAASINVEKTIAVCPACSHVFNFADMVSTRKSKPRKLKAPDGFEVDDTPGRPLITWRALPRTEAERLQRSVGIGIFLLLEFALLAFAFAIGLAMQNALGFMLMFLFIGLLPGTFIGYLALASLSNRGEIWVEDDSLYQRRRPFPYGPIQRYPRGDIISVRPMLNLAAASQGGVRRYDVLLKTRGLGEQTFLSSFSEYQAAFIAQELNRALFDEPNAEDEDTTAAPEAMDADEAFLIDEAPLHSGKGRGE